MQIPPINPMKVNQLQDIAGPKKPTAPSGVQQATQSFETVLNSLNNSQTQSDDLVKKLSLGENVDLHQVMIGMEQNSVNFQVAIAMRDKLVDAYREVMRMNI